jgi:hypothetical protein
MTAHITIIIDDSHTVNIECFDTPIGHKYSAMLKSQIDSKGILTDDLMSFSNYLRKDQIQDIMLEAFSNINKFFKQDIIAMESVDWDDQIWHNKLHTIFEKLNGDWNNPSRLMLVAPNNILEAVRRVNWGVHQLEGYPFEKAWHMEWSKNPKECVDRIKFVEEDYDCVVFQYQPWTVYLGYNEVGKEYRDLHEDNLPIEYPGLKNNHYLGLDIDINQSKTGNVFANDFKEWMIKHKIDPYDKQLGIGKFPVGRYSQDFDNNVLSSTSQITEIIYEN